MDRNGQQDMSEALAFFKHFVANKSLEWQPEDYRL